VLGEQAQDVPPRVVGVGPLSYFVQLGLQLLGQVGLTISCPSLHAVSPTSVLTPPAVPQRSGLAAFAFQQAGLRCAEGCRDRPPSPPTAAPPLDHGCSRAARLRSGSQAVVAKLLHSPPPGPGGSAWSHFALLHRLEALLPSLARSPSSISRAASVWRDHRGKIPGARGHTSPASSCWAC
jgi:hypothetical protein